MEEKEVCYHVPVMLHESLEGLDIQPSGVYVDVTFGGGGHSREILNRLNDEGSFMDLIKMPMRRKTFRRIPVLYLSAVIFVTYITSCVIMV